MGKGKKGFGACALLTLLLAALACARDPAAPDAAGGSSSGGAQTGGQDASGGVDGEAAGMSASGGLQAGGRGGTPDGAGGEGEGDGGAGGASPEQPEPFLVFCGNGVVDGDDVCEGLTGCERDERCNSSCRCEPQPVLALSSQALIQRALDAHQIDFYTSLKLRVWALFQAPELPEEYVGAGSEGEDVYLALELGYQRSREADNMAAIEAAIAPYLSRPNDPSSVYAQSAGAGCPKDALGASDWRTTETEHFVIWSCGGGVDGSDPFADARVSAGAAAEQAWTAMVPELRAPLPDDVAVGPGDQSRSDIYLVPLNACRQRNGECEPIPGEPFVGAFPSSPCNYAWSDHWNNAVVSSAYLEFDASSVPSTTTGADFARFRYALAHQFYHALSFASSLGAQGGACAHYAESASQSWLTEASAEWASFAFFADDDPGRRTRLFHDYQTYRRLDQDGLGTLHSQLPREAFLYLAFLQEQHAGDPSEVLRFLRDNQYAAVSDQLETPLEVRLDLHQQFREFSLRNFNRDLPGTPIVPHSHYDAALPFDSPAAAVLEPTVELQASSELERPLLLPPLGSQIEHWSMDEQVHSLSIDFSQVLDNEHLSLDVVVKVADRYEHRAIAGTVYEFCRDDDSGADVSELYLIFSNSNREPVTFDQARTGSYQVSTSSHCRTGWSGDVHVTRTNAPDGFTFSENSMTWHDDYTVRGSEPGQVPGYPPDAPIERLDLSWRAYATAERLLEEQQDDKTCWTHSTHWVAGSGTTLVYAYQTAAGYSLEAVGVPNTAKSLTDETSNCSAFLYGVPPVPEDRDAFQRSLASLVADSPGSGHFTGSRSFDNGDDGQVLVEWDLWRKARVPR